MKNKNIKDKELTDHFPPVVSSLIRAGARSIGCPEEYLITAVLVIVSISIGSSVSIKVKNGWIEFCSLYAVIIGNPSMKKTPALNLAKKPLEIIQGELYKVFEKERENHINLSKKEKETSQEPSEVVAYTSDTTIEGLLKYLAINFLGVAMVLDELSHMFKSLNAYKQGGGDRQYLLQLYNSSQIKVTRKGSHSLQIDKPVFSILGGIQPQVLKGFFTDGQEDGLNERFIYSFPAQILETKFVDEEVDQEVIDDYNNLVKELYYTSFESVKNNDEKEYTLSLDAREEWIQWQEGQGITEDNVSYLKKAHSHCLRISLVLEVLNNSERDSLEVSLISMKGAIDITNFYIANYFKLYDEMHKSKEDDKAGNLLKWMRKNKTKYKTAIRLREGIPIRKIYSNNVSGIKSYHEAVEYLTELQDKKFGMLYPSEIHPIPNDKKPRIFILFDESILGSIKI
jgi:hypothetical protein